MSPLIQSIQDRAATLDRDVKFMEVCGTHTMSAFRSGLRELLPANVHLISGPGCPVCVTDASFVDAAIDLCRQPAVTVATFGDLLRVPGTDTSLQQERAAGADVRIVYSPTDALALAERLPDREVVFLGVGFETTAPTVAWSVDRAAEDGINNYSVLCAHKTMPQAMEALLKDQDVQIDGFICPGHVSVITGARMYRPLCERYRVPCVISGFEATDMLQSIVMLLDQVCHQQAAVEIQYSRSVGEHGNRAAQQLLNKVFEPATADWRGLGAIPGSGLNLRDEYADHDAARKFDLTFAPARVHPGCRCGDVLRGVIDPLACQLFGKACTPINPFGPCMVSDEGTCAAYFKYQRRAEAA